MYEECVQKCDPQPWGVRGRHRVLQDPQDTSTITLGRHIEIPGVTGVLRGPPGSPDAPEAAVETQEDGILVIVASHESQPFPGPAATTWGVPSS